MHWPERIGKAERVRRHIFAGDQWRDFRHRNLLLNSRFNPGLTLLQLVIPLTCVRSRLKVTHMQKTQIYLRKEELEALRQAAARSGRSVAEVVRDAIRKVVLKPPASGPVAIWDGQPKRGSIEHDSIHDEP